MNKPTWKGQSRSKRAGEFDAAGHIDSNWTLGSKVLWRNAKGKVYVDGNVTAVDPGRLLRFTVCDVLNPDLRPTSGLADDEITQSYALAADGERTILATARGDFGKLANGARLYPLLVQLWDRLLAKIKDLAEFAKNAV